MSTAAHDAVALGNVMWTCLSGSHAHWSEGQQGARRYARGFSPLLGFADPTAPDFDGLSDCTDSGEQFYVAEWAGPEPRGWRIVQEARMLRLCLPRTASPASVALKDSAVTCVELSKEHTHQALALAQLQRPGPFGPRTLELGDYLGIFAADELVAMAGERMQAGHWREISGVCSAPSVAGRGYAAYLMAELMRRARARDERSFLHVMRENAVALRLYERLGFVFNAEVVVRVVERL